MSKIDISRLRYLYQADDGAQRMTRRLALYEEPQVDRTIFCANDGLAIGAIRAANRYAFFSSGPSNAFRCRIADHDDFPLSAFVNTSLTTVASNTEGVGPAAAEQILDQIQCN